MSNEARLPEHWCALQKKETSGSSITTAATDGWGRGCRSVTQPTRGKHTYVVEWHSLFHCGT